MQFWYIHLSHSRTTAPCFRQHILSAQSEPLRTLGGSNSSRCGAARVWRRKCRSEVSIRSVDQRSVFRSVDKKCCSEVSLKSVAQKYHNVVRSVVQKCCSELGLLIRSELWIRRRVNHNCGSQVSLKSVARKCQSKVLLRSVAQKCRSELLLGSFRSVLNKCCSQVSFIAQRRRSELSPRSRWGTCVEMLLELSLSVCGSDVSLKGVFRVLPGSVAHRCFEKRRSKASLTCVCVCACVCSDVLLRSVNQRCRSGVDQKCRSEVSIRSVDQKCCSEVSLRSVN